MKFASCESMKINDSVSKPKYISLQQGQLTAIIFGIESSMSQKEIDFDLSLL